MSLDVKCQILEIMGDSGKEGRVVRRLLEGWVVDALEQGDVDRFEREARGLVEMYAQWHSIGMTNSSQQSLITSLWLWRLVTTDR